MLKIARRLTMFALLATTTILGGCGDDPSGPETISGTYVLQTVNNQALPYTLVDDPEFGKWEIMSSTVEFRSDRTWSETALFRTTEPGGQPTMDPPETIEGTYVRNGNVLTLESDGDEIVYTIQSNGDLVVADQGITARYRRQYAMRQLVRRLALAGTLALALATTGCSDDEGSQPSSLPGTYVLRTVDDQPLPFVLVDEPAQGYRLSLVGGTVTLRSDGRYDDAIDYREVEAGITRDESVKTAGRWGPDGDVVMFVSDDEHPQEQATIASNGDLLYTFDYTFGRHVLRFERLREATMQ